MESARRGRTGARVTGGILAVLCTLASSPAFASNDPATTEFSWDLRIGGYFAASANRTVWAGLAGVQFGATHWFEHSLVGLQFLAGPQIGYMSTSLGVLAVTGDAGVVFALGDYRRGTNISINWAPKVLFDFVGGKGEVASPVGAEVAFNFSGFKIPIWALQTLDGTTFLGLAIGLGF